MNASNIIKNIFIFFLQFALFLKENIKKNTSKKLHNKNKNNLHPPKQKAFKIFLLASKRNFEQLKARSPDFIR